MNDDLVFTQGIVSTKKRRPREWEVEQIKKRLLRELEGCTGIEVHGPLREFIGCSCLMPACTSHELVYGWVMYATGVKG